VLDFSPRLSCRCRKALEATCSRALFGLQKVKLNVRVFAELANPSTCVALDLALRFAQATLDLGD